MFFDYRPPAAFYFRVDIHDGLLGLAKNPMGLGFRSISGMEAEMESLTIEEGGENRFVHVLPGKVKYDKLVMKRGLQTVGLATPLLDWCLDTMSMSINKKIKTKDITVSVLNDNHLPVVSWRFIKAYPTKWVIGELDSHEDGEVLIEEVEFAYQYFKREDSSLLGGLAAVSSGLAMGQGLVKGATNAAREVKEMIDDPSKIPFASTVKGVIDTAEEIVELTGVEVPDEDQVTENTEDFDNKNEEVKEEVKENEETRKKDEAETKAANEADEKEAEGKGPKTESADDFNKIIEQQKREAEERRRKREEAAKKEEAEDKKEEDGD